MLFYLFIIFISTLGVYVTRRKHILVTILIGILPISLFAGLRDTTVGTDLGVYVIRLWDSCQYSTYSDVIYYNALMEKGYVLFCYFVHKLSSDLNVFLFIEHFILLSLLFYYIRKIDVDNTTLLYFIVITFLFNESLNLMRQFFTLVLCVGAFICLKNKQFFKFICYILIASFFHSSIALLVLLLPILYFLEKFSNKALLIQFIIFAGGILFFFFFPVVLESLINYGLLNVKYIRYLNQDFSTHKVDFILSGVLYLITYIGHSDDLNNKNLLRVLSILTFILTMCGVYNDVASRVAMYLYIYTFVILFIYMHTLHAYKKKLCCFIISSIVLFRFVFISLTTDYSGTIPYTSKILGIE